MIEVGGSGYGQEPGRCVSLSGFVARYPGGRRVGGLGSRGGVQRLIEVGRGTRWRVNGVSHDSKEVSFAYFSAG